MSYELVILNEEEFDVFQLSHDLKKHQKETKCPLNIVGIPFSNGLLYDVHMCNKTEKYRTHIRYCENIALYLYI